MSGLRLTAGAWLIAAACYDPTIPTGAPCEDSTQCPSDQECIDHVCGGMPSDAVAIDADPTTPDASPPPPDAPPLSQYVVFVTSVDYTGSIGGLAGADTQCTTLAMAAGLAGSFRAWLTDQNPSNAPAQRFYQANAPYVLPDGTVVANNFAQLISGTVLHQIDLNESGLPITPTVPSCSVWTATSDLGEKSLLLDGNQGQFDHTCGSWTSSATGVGFVGGSILASQLSAWSEACGGDFGVCNQRKHLYCFQQG